MGFSRKITRWLTGWLTTITVHLGCLLGWTDAWNAGIARHRRRLLRWTGRRHSRAIAVQCRGLLGRRCGFRRLSRSQQGCEALIHDCRRLGLVCWERFLWHLSWHLGGSFGWSLAWGFAGGTWHCEGLFVLSCVGCCLGRDSSRVGKGFGFFDGRGNETLLLYLFRD
jgi:hypothetical protein